MIDSTEVERHRDPARIFSASTAMALLMCGRGPMWHGDIVTFVTAPEPGDENLVVSNGEVSSIAQVNASQELRHDRRNQAPRQLMLATPGVKHFPATQELKDSSCCPEKNR